MKPISLPCTNSDGTIVHRAAYVDGEPVAGLAVTQFVHDDGGPPFEHFYWTITHMLSGKSTFPGSLSLKRAREALAIMTREMDWNVPDPPTDMGSAAYASRVQEAVRAHAPIDVDDLFEWPALLDSELTSTRKRLVAVTAERDELRAQLQGASR